MVPALGVVRVHADAHAKQVLQVEEGLLHVADHHGYVGDAGFVELADEPLYEHLAAHGEQALGALIGQRRYALAHARGEDDGTPWWGDVRGGAVGGEGLAHMRALPVMPARTAPTTLRSCGV